jgi:D-galactarolactone cycloisomerase
LLVESIEAFPLKIKVREDLRAGTFSYDNYMTVLIRVVCDGQQGWGEAMTRFSPGSTAAMIEEYFSPIIKGKDFDQPVSAWNLLWRTLQVRGHTRGTDVEALSGLEIALWDAYGRIKKSSIADLLGKNSKETVPVYAGSIFASRGDLQDQINQVKERGFGGVKVKIGFELDKDLKLLREVRKAWHEGTIIADANCAYELLEARKATKLFSEVKPAWLEEPLASDNFVGYSQLSKDRAVPIGAGESWFASDFESPIQEKIIDVFEPSVSRCGGISVNWNFAKEAGKRGIRYAPMVGANSAISLAASLQIASIAENLIAVEVEPFGNPLVSGLCPKFPSPKKGVQEIPKGFGLGVDVDESFLRRHTSSR